MPPGLTHVPTSCFVINISDRDSFSGHQQSTCCKSCPSCLPAPISRFPEDYGKGSSCLTPASQVRNSEGGRRDGYFLPNCCFLVLKLTFLNGRSGKEVGFHSTHCVGHLGCVGEHLERRRVSTWERFPVEMKKGCVCKVQGGKTPFGLINEVISLNEPLGRQAQVGEVQAGLVEERCHLKAFSCPSLPACPEDSQDTPLACTHAAPSQNFWDWRNESRN